MMVARKAECLAASMAILKAMQWAARKAVRMVVNLAGQKVVSKAD